MKKISSALLTYLAILPCLSLCQSVQVFIGETGPHHRVVNKVTSFVVPDGRTIIKTNFYIEVATGIHYREVNRRLYDPSGTGTYVLPDVHFPKDGVAFEGTIANKTPSTPQGQRANSPFAPVVVRFQDPVLQILLL